MGSLKQTYFFLSHLDSDKYTEWRNNFCTSTRPCILTCPDFPYFKRVAYHSCNRNFLCSSFISKKIAKCSSVHIYKIHAQPIDSSWIRSMILRLRGSLHTFIYDVANIKRDEQKFEFHGFCSSSNLSGIFNFLYCCRLVSVWCRL